MTSEMYHGNVPRRGVVPRFSDLEVLALSATAEVFGIDSENYLFHRLKNECADRFPNLITRRQYNQRRKLTYCLGEEIRKDIAAAIDGRENVFSIDSKLVKVCQNARAARCAMGRETPELAPHGATVHPKACIITDINSTQSAE